MVAEAERDLEATVKAALNGDVEEREWLQAHPEEWYGALVDIKLDIERQMIQRKAFLNATHADWLASGRGAGKMYFEAAADYERWRARAVHFKTIIEVELRRIKPLRRAAQARAYMEESIDALDDASAARQMAGMTQRLSSLHAAVQSLTTLVSELEARVSLLERGR